MFRRPPEVWSLMSDNALISGTGKVGIVIRAVWYCGPVAHCCCSCYANGRVCDALIPLVVRYMSNYRKNQRRLYIEFSPDSVFLQQNVFFLTQPIWTPPILLLYISIYTFYKKRKSRTIVITQKNDRYYKITHTIASHSTRDWFIDLH